MHPPPPFSGALSRIKNHTSRVSLPYRLRSCIMGRMSRNKLNGEPRASTRGKTNPITNQANWTRMLRAEQVKFDDEAKGRFLEAIVRHGKRGLAAQEVGISIQTFRNHIKIDPEFAELFDAAIQERADRVTAQIEEEALEGFEEPIYSQKTGELLGTKRVYETPIRLAILKRYDPEYKDRSETTISGAVGVLVAPAQMTPQDWIAQEQLKNATRVEPDKDNLDAPPSAAARAAHQLMAPDNPTPA